MRHRLQHRNRRPRQALSFEAYTGIFGADGFTDSLTLTLKLAAATIALVLVLLVPALVTVRLAAPRLRTLVEIVCMLPLVVPAVALVAGISAVLRWGPTTLPAPRSSKPWSRSRTRSSPWFWCSPTR